MAKNSPMQHVCSFCKRLVTIRDQYDMPILDPQTHYFEYYLSVSNLRIYEHNGETLIDATITNSFSIVADKYAYANFHKIRYLEYMGTKWKVESVDASTPPRLTLDVGAVYND